MISPSIVVSPEGAKKQVKNLGWLLRNWKQVSHFEVEQGRVAGEESYLIAFLYGGRRYETGFASHDVLMSWLDRPVFRGLRVGWKVIGEK